MEIRQIIDSLSEAIDAGDADVIERYAEHCAEGMNELGELLCIAIIEMDRPQWLAVMSVTSQKTPKLADALEAIERHIDRERHAFIGKRANLGRSRRGSRSPVRI
ncbi:hypothetical protein WG219_11325 [Ectopseudomonas mendocina]|uniref:Uncharacterized protein n=1 Tax=Ectopseudomonas mendocina TaxID=300 RepID=A0ABZ2RGY5_ECTME